MHVDSRSHCGPVHKWPPPTRPVGETDARGARFLCRGSEWCRETGELVVRGAQCFGGAGAGALGIKMQRNSAFWWVALALPWGRRRCQARGATRLRCE